MDELDEFFKAILPALLTRNAPDATLVCAAWDLAELCVKERQRRYAPKPSGGCGGTGSGSTAKQQDPFPISNLPKSDIPKKIVKSVGGEAASSQNKTDGAITSQTMESWRKTDLAFEEAMRHTKGKASGMIGGGLGGGSAHGADGEVGPPGLDGVSAEQLATAIRWALCQLWQCDETKEVRITLRVLLSCWDKRTPLELRETESTISTLCESVPELRKFKILSI